MRFSRIAGAALLFSLLLTACVPSAVKPAPAEVAAAQSAQALAQRGQLDQAAQAYLQLADAHRARADHYRLLAAQAYRQEGELARAAPLLDQISREGLSGDEPTRLDLLRAELALQQHDPRTALKLTTAPHLNVPAELQARLLELRARAMAATGDVWGAARTRVEMDSGLSGLDRSQNRGEVMALLEKLGVPALRQRAAAMHPGDRMLAWINEALVHQGVAVARPQAQLGQPVGTMTAGAGANVREGYRMPRQVALLLPAGHGYAAATASIRQGFFAAYAQAANTHAPRADVRLYDSGGDAAGAARAYQQAVADGAQLVVGPLTRDAVAGAVGQATLPVPLLTLNYPDQRGMPPANVMEFGLLPETEGAQAADHMVEQGLRSAYVIISSQDFAQRAASAFKAEMIARGGQILGMSTLSPGAFNYGAAINGLGAGSAPPGTGIFISMRPEEARLLVPQLQIARITLPIFATSYVYSGDDDAGRNRDLDGVQFCDAPWLFAGQPGLPSRNDLAGQLPSARGAAARLFAFGMDAWNLVPYLEWLRNHVGSYLPGATGQLTADQFGRIRRVLVWAKFVDGVAQPQSGSLQLDNVPSIAPPAADAPASAASAVAPMPVGSSGP